MLPSVMLVLAALAPTVAGHGMLTRPAARNVLLNAGLTNPGAGQCDISSPNAANMNGCQGGVGPFTFNTCWTKCGGNFLATSGDCKQCKQQVVASALSLNGFRRINVQPEPRLGVCGDLAEHLSLTDPALKDCNGKSCVEEALSKSLDTVVVNQADKSFDVSVKITAYHYGWFEFRLCPQGGRGLDGRGVTQECFNQHVLRFDAAEARARYSGKMDSKGAQDPSDYIGTKASSRCDGQGAELKLEAPEMWSPPGSCCFNGGDCGDSNISRDQDVRFVLPASTAGPDYSLKLFLPAGLSCTQSEPCTLQWTYMTGNTEDGYPEVFRNCADFKLGSAGSAPSPTSPPSASQSSTTSPTTMPTAGLAPSSTAAPSASGSVCVRNTDCTENSWCNQASYDAWCADHSLSECPAPQCRAGSSSGTSSSTLAPTPQPTSDHTPEPQPTPEPEPEPEATTNPCSSCSGCLATNNVCYDELKSWCDNWAAYIWCGEEPVLAETSRRKVRSRRGTFLGTALLQTAWPLSRTSSEEL